MILFIYLFGVVFFSGGFLCSSFWDNPSSERAAVSSWTTAYRILYGMYVGWTWPILLLVILGKHVGDFSGPLKRS